MDWGMGRFVALASPVSRVEDQVLDSGTVAPPSWGGVRSPAVAGGPALAGHPSTGAAASAAAAPLDRGLAAGPPAAAGAEGGPASVDAGRVVVASASNDDCVVDWGTAAPPAGGA